MKHKNLLKIALLMAMMISVGKINSQIISQYVETNSGTTPKGIEIWNNTGATLDFATNNLIIQQGTNGAAPSNLSGTLIDSGVLAPGEVLVIGTSDIGTYLTEQGLFVRFVSFGLSFNGDDSLVVRYGDTTTDVFGNPGSDPGSAWSGSGVSTANQNIRLLSSITTGDLDGWTDPSTRFETVSTTPATLPAGLSGFGVPPNSSLWTGAIDTDWSTAGNWVDGVPIATNGFVIPSGLTNYPSASSSVTITSGIMYSGASLIAQDAFTGTITYKRALAYNALITEGWHLVSSPVVGETYDNAYVSANGLAINASNNAIATYTTGTNAWSYMQTGGGATFTPGIGYSVKKQSSAGDISFTGTLNTTDVSVSVVTGGTNSFNLIGNPFTSYLNSEAFLNGNSGSLVSTDIWVFNQSSGNYEVKNLAASFVLAPAQGFFVRANAATNLTIAESYQVATGNAFLKTVKPEITLNMTDGSNNRFAKIYYLDNATTSFDNGYDGETFGGVANSVDVFTHLVANSVGKKYQVQSLPNSDFENMVVPVGIKAAAGKEIIFSAEAMNLSDGINVYLEDRATNTVTLLSEANATYKVTLGESLDGIGRFYLHTKASGVLSTSEVALDNISIYSPAKSTLRIAGLTQGKASVKIYSVLGKQVFANTYNTTGVIDMNLPTLATGLYVVQLATEKGTLNKKITLE
jgi:hypothetical protein